MESEDNEPPKKKLKQAQLPFCNQLIKNKKRKCSSDIDMKQECKLMCKDDEAGGNVMNKENVILIEDSNSNELIGAKSMEICETQNNPTVKTGSESEAKESLGMLESASKTKHKAASHSETTDELSNKSISESVLIKKNVESINLDEKNNDPTNKSITSDIIESNCSDEDNQKENESNFTSDDALNQSKSLSISSEDELSERSNKDNAMSPNSSASANTLKRKLTPRVHEKRKMRESIKQEKLQQKEKEREAKLKMKLEKEEQKKKEKEEKEELKRKEKEEKEKKKMAELKQKEEERRLKEQERKKKEEAKEEEKRLKEEERRRKDEAKEEERKKKEEAKLIEQRKEDQAKKFLSKYFFLKKTKSDNAEPADTNDQPKFMPFPVKPDMRLAEVKRRVISSEDKSKLDSFINLDKHDEKLYLNELKTRDHIPHKTESTWPLSEEQHDVIIIESVIDKEVVDGSPENSKKSKKNLKKAKLLQFHENRRPAYWGTWRKKSSTVTSRKPFLKDVSLNYEVDSDSEWEDEGEGEDIGNDESDKEHSDEENSDEKDENGYILDNTFVPHGYLSDEEVHPDEENFDPEDQKLRLKVLKKEFEEEMKMKTQRLKPRLLGCVWISNDTTAVSKGSLYEVLMKYRAVWDEDNGPIKVFGPTIEASPTVSSSANSRQLSPKVMEQLAKFVHGNHLSLYAMVNEFLNLMEKENYPLLSKRALSIKIKEIARKELDDNGKQLWSVSNELCNEYGLTTSTQVNTSNIEKPKDTFLENFLKRPSVSPQQTSLSSPKVEPPVPSSSSTVLQPPSTPAQQPVKKRATLITLQQTPTSENNKTINKVHKDTPRPLHPFFKSANSRNPTKRFRQDTNDDGVINLCDEEN